VISLIHKTKLVVYLSFLFFFFNLKISAQQSSKPAGSNATLTNMVSTTIHDTCLNRRFSIVFYLVQDSSYSLNPINTSTIITPMINALNAAFKPICVEFVACSTVFIPNWSYLELDIKKHGPALFNSYYTPKTINLYYSAIVGGSPNGEVAYTYPIPALNSAAQFTDAVITGWNGPPYPTPTNIPALIHAFGHFFGLPDTWAEINPGTPANPPPPVTSPTITSMEWATRGANANCYIHGDGFCDTEADPFGANTGVNPYRNKLEACGYKYGLKDGNGDYYFPPVDNYMSYYKCRCKFSQEQYNFMAHFIMTRRNYLH